jgi:hypothetical protein
LKKNANILRKRKETEFINIRKNRVSIKVQGRRQGIGLEDTISSIKGHRQEISRKNFVQKSPNKNPKI